MPRRLRSAPADHLPDAERPQRRIRRRSPLPNGRAVAGGFLVAVAALGVAGAHLAADSMPSTRYVVTTRPVPPGQVVAADDLELVVVELPDPLTTTAYQQVDEVEGAVALGPIGSGELVQRAALLPRGADAPAPQRELSVSLERAQAVDGRLLPGDVVDLLATYGTGESAYTETVARAATVRAASGTEDGGFGSTGLVVLTLALDRPEDLLAATHAMRTDALTVVRSTGAPASSDSSGTYRPLPPDEAPTPDPDGVDAGQARSSS